MDPCSDDAVKASDAVNPVIVDIAVPLLLNNLRSPPVAPNVAPNVVE